VICNDEHEDSAQTSFSFVGTVLKCRKDVADASKSKYFCWQKIYS
jgi:hypothetical protein